MESKMKNEAKIGIYPLIRLMKIKIINVES